MLCFLFQFFLLPESMPDGLKRPFSCSNLMPFTYYWLSIKMIAKQGLLIGGESSIGSLPFFGLYWRV